MRNAKIQNQRNKCSVFCILQEKTFERSNRDLLLNMHSSKNGEVITKPEARKFILMKERRCFFVNFLILIGLMNVKRAGYASNEADNFAICTFKKPDEDNKSQVQMSVSQKLMQIC